MTWSTHLKNATASDSRTHVLRFDPTTLRGPETTYRFWPDSERPESVETFCKKSHQLQNSVKTQTQGNTEKVAWLRSSLMGPALNQPKAQPVLKNKTADKEWFFFFETDAPAKRLKAMALASVANA